MAGVHPFIDLLQQGADVIIGGRSSDSCVFAAPAIHHGFPGEPGVLPRQGARMRVVLRRALRRQGDGAGRDHRGCASRSPPCIPAQRCTVASVAGHAMYERSNPYFEHVAGGTLDMSDCRYEQVAEKTTRITGAKFVPAAEFRVKLEGAGKIGERYVGMVGIRDPYTIAHVDEVIGWARQQVRERFGDSGLRAPLHRLRPRRRDGRARAAAQPAWRTSCASSCRAWRRPRRWRRRSA